MVRGRKLFISVTTGTLRCKDGLVQGREVLRLARAQEEEPLHSDTRDRKVVWPLASAKWVPEVHCPAQLGFRFLFP